MNKLGIDWVDDGNNSTIEIFSEYFWTFRLKDRLSFLSLHVDHPQEGTTRFLNSLRDIASEINFDYKRFNELLEEYLNSSTKDNLSRLNNFVNSYCDDIETELVAIPNDFKKAYCSLKGFIDSKNFDNYFQVYDAIVLFEDEISPDLIKEIIVEWKQDKQFHDYNHSLGDSSIFWVSYDFMKVIDSISMYRFKETFDVKGFDTTFDEVRKNLMEIIWEFSPPHDLSDGPFYFWLIDRVPNFINDYHATTHFLEHIIEEQTSKGFWENKNIIKSEIFDEKTHRIKYREFEKNTSGTALCSINIIKHSKYDNLRDMGIKGAKWLLEQQNSDGSWSDEISSRSSGKIENKKSLFATLLALEALIRSDIPNITPQIELAFEWIMSKQNKWGWWEDDEFQPLFAYSSFPLMTIFVLELKNLFEFYKGKKLVASENSKKIPQYDYEFDIAVSFAGENRKMVEKYVSILKSNGLTVFYDEDKRSELWGKNLVDELHEVYSSKARFCAIFISEHYLEKSWTNHERQAAQERAFKEKSEYILPIKLDDTEIPGLSTSIAYLDLRDLTIEAIALEI